MFEPIEIPLWLMPLICCVWTLASLFVYTILDKTFEEPELSELIVIGSIIWPLGLSFYILWGVINIIDDFTIKNGIYDER